MNTDANKETVRIKKQLPIIKNQLPITKREFSTGSFQEILSNFGAMRAEEMYFHRYDDGDWCIEVITEDREVFKSSGPFNIVCIKVAMQLNSVSSNCIVMRF